MAWVRIDDDLFSHPKILRAWWTDKASIGLWPQGLSWAGRQLTDGYVSAEFVRGLLPNRRERDRATGALVDAALWVPNGSGWEIHDWSDYNASREQTLARRDADAARKRTPR
jgi:hypothetical protein